MKLNMDKITQMEAGTEIDTLVGEKVMGWHLIPAEPDWKQMWLDSANKFMHNNWSPSTDISAAWEVVDMVYLAVIKRTSDPTNGSPSWWEVRRYLGQLGIIAPTAPLAICRAALLSVMWE